MHLGSMLVTRERLPHFQEPRPLHEQEELHVALGLEYPDLIFKPSGTQGYDDLARSAITYEVFGVEVRAASLKDILRSKLTSNRPQDQRDVIVLKEMLKKRQ